MSKIVDYWIKREQEKFNYQVKDVKQLENELKKEFKRAANDIETEIFKLFAKYSIDNDLAYLEAARMLTSKEFKSWKYDLKTYIRLIEETEDEKLLLELNTLAMKSRISRLEEMLYQVNKHIDETFRVIDTGAYKLLGGSVSNSYYQTIYNIHKFRGIATSFSNVDKDMIEKVLSYPWSGKNYSARIWSNRDKLKDVLQSEITQMVIQGRGSKDVAIRVAEKMETSLSNAIRLVHTEHSYVMNEGSKLGYKETNVEKYQYLATLDNRTSDKCQSLDLKVFNLNDAVVGVNYPPAHVRCRSTTIPYFEEDKSTRFARDENDKSIEVSSDMKYSEWYEKFVKDK